VGVGAPATQTVATKVGRVGLKNQSSGSGGAGGASHNTRENGVGGNQSADKSRTNKNILPTLPVKKAVPHAVPTRPPTITKSRELGHSGSTKAPLTASKVPLKTVSNILKSSTNTTKSTTSTSSSLRSSTADEATTRSRVSSNGTISSAKTSAGRNDPATRTSASNTKAIASALGKRGSRISAGELPSAKQDLHRTSSVNDKNGTKKTSSRLLAPTASSLAKTQSINRGLNSTKDEPAASSGADAGEQPAAPGRPQTPPTTLRMITDNPASIVTSLKVDKALSSVGGPAPMEFEPPTLRGRVVPTRKPRISRSKVIAKLVVHRAASNAASFASSGSRALASSSKTRSSIGAVTGGVKAGRMSGGNAAVMSGGSAVVMSAKRRVRQSEYARRRSGVAPSAVREHPEVDGA
jgi:hypothetical protein